MKLYLHPASPNCVAVLAAAGLADVRLQTEVVDAFNLQHRSPEYLAINPNGLFPVLVDGDFVLWETNAILQYLAEREPARRLWPRDARARADVSRWQFWSVAHFTTALQPFLYQNIFKRLKGEGEPDPQALEAALPRLRQVCGVLERHLSGRDWLVGEAPTLADLSVASFLMYAEPAQIPLSDYPQLRRWSAAVQALPAWTAARAA